MLFSFSVRDVAKLGMSAGAVAVASAMLSVAQRGRHFRFFVARFAERWCAGGVPWVIGRSRLRGEGNFLPPPRTVISPSAAMNSRARVCAPLFVAAWFLSFSPRARGATARRYLC